MCYVNDGSATRTLNVINDCFANRNNVWVIVLLKLLTQNLKCPLGYLEMNSNEIVFTKYLLIIIQCRSAKKNCTNLDVKMSVLFVI